MNEDTLKAQLARDPSDGVAARALSEIYERDRRWKELVEHLVSRLEHLEDPNARAGICEQAAEIFHGRIGNPASAFFLWLQAFSETGSDERYGRRLGHLAQKTGQWEELLDAYEARCTDGPESTAIRRRLATWYTEMGAHEEAADHLRAILAHSPDDASTALAFEDHLSRIGAWAELVQQLRRRIRASVDPTTRRELRQRAARVQETHLNDAIGAMSTLGETLAEWFDDATEINIERIADESGSYGVLADILDTALRNAQERGESQPERHLRVAILLETHRNDQQRAVFHYRRAYEQDSENTRALIALRRLLEATERWDELAPILAREASLPAERLEQFERFLHLGDLYRDKLNRNKEAVASWFKALEAVPDERRALVRLLDLYRETQQYDATIRVLSKLISIEKTPRRKARYYYAMGIVQRDEMNDHYIAVRSLDKALEHDPTLIKAFQAIDEILTDDQDFERQDRYYRKMLVRAREHQLDEALIVKIASNLGEINRSRLGNYSAALKAYEVVLRHHPADIKIRSIVAELHELSDHLDQAIEQQQMVLELAPNRARTYRELGRLYTKMGAHDSAWCIYRALVILNAAQPEQIRAFEEGRQRQRSGVARPLDPTCWQLVTWPSKPEAIDSAFIQSYRFVAPFMLETAKTLKLSRRDQISDAKSGVFGQVLQHVCEAMSMDRPPLWFDRRRMGLGTAHFALPAILIGADIHNERPVPELAFLFGRQLYLMSQQHVLATIDQSPAAGRLRTLHTLASLVRYLFPESGASPIDPNLMAAFRDLPPGNARLLADQLRPWLNVPNLGIDQWLDAVEHTANRVGLVLCNDLETSVRLIRAERRPLSNASVEERIFALVSFSTSPAYFEVRRRLGYAQS